ncbi:hypothetical protein WOLCODRAFT_20859 [Wolfiporia cocos MD-104 SS10]|uniref:Uncharacterized protein n=1 Tax=Wolfiporia cocos (strain MD-104) TaxID=742152 RepID=A0A2H3JJY4_WOLCO|nr:hypothetical protein WOLCODRAFT_20859 [Wolfiporia cocos MD-104 SS10]
MNAVNTHVAYSTARVTVGRMYFALRLLICNRRYCNGIPSRRDIAHYHLRYIQEEEEAARTRSVRVNLLIKESVYRGNAPSLEDHHLRSAEYVYLLRRLTNGHQMENPCHGSGPFLRRRSLIASFKLHACNSVPSVARHTTALANDQSTCIALTARASLPLINSVIDMTDSNKKGPVACHSYGGDIHMQRYKFDVNVSES